MPPESAPSSSQETPAFHQLSPKTPCQPPPLLSVWPNVGTSVFLSTCHILHFEYMSGFSEEDVLFHALCLLLLQTERLIVSFVAGLGSRMINRFCTPRSEGVCFKMLTSSLIQAISQSQE